VYERVITSPGDINLKKMKIVVMSDMHLGDARSTLREPNVIGDLINELNQDKGIDELILLGDVLDLAFSNFQDVIHQARAFFNQIGNLNIKEEGKIVYVPGNHDYHIWLLHIEKRDIIERVLAHSLPQLPNYINSFSGKESFFSEVLPKNLEKKFMIRYPNYQFENNGIKYLLHHGHQVYGPCVSLMSPKEALNEGKGLNDFLIANSPILELMYYHLERSKEMRKELEYAWKKYGSPGAILVVINELLDARVPRLARRLTHKIRTLWLRFTIKTIKKDRGTGIDEIQDEIRDYLKLCGWPLQNPLRFIFGHTHVPDGKKINNKVTVVNCGSWLKEDTRHNTYLLIKDNVLTLRKLGEKDPIF
jgi:predicted phosphodiesterase